MNEGVIALIAALFGGAGLKIIEAILNRNKDSFNDATVIRQELREEGSRLKDEVKSLDTILDEWKVKYYDLVKRSNEDQWEIEKLKMEIKVITDKYTDLLMSIENRER